VLDPAVETKSALITEPGEEIYRKIDEERVRKEEFIKQRMQIINKLSELIGPY